MSRSLQFFFVHGSWILGFAFFLSVWSSGVDFFKVLGNTYQSKLVDLNGKTRQSSILVGFHWRYLSFYLALFVPLSRNFRC